MCNNLSWLEFITNRLTIHTKYRDHITELNSARPKQPFFFQKPTSSILLPGQGPVVRPRGVNLHYEVELALIIGKQVKDLDAADEKGALDAVESESHASPDYTPLLTPRIQATLSAST